MPATPEAYPTSYNGRCPRCGEISTDFEFVEGVVQCAFCGGSFQLVKPSDGEPPDLIAEALGDMEDDGELI